MKTRNNTIPVLFLLISIVASNILLATINDENKLLVEAKKISKEAYIKFDKSLFLKSYGLCERMLSSEPNNSLALYYAGYNLYRLLIIAMANNNMEEFDEYSDSAIKNVKQLIDVEEYKSEAKTLLAAIYMMKLSIDKLEAPALSMKINKYLEEAGAYDPNNPRTHLIRGTMLLNTPPMFGGSIDKALNNFNKATSIFELNTSAKKQIDWGYLETLAWRGMALSKKGDFVNAKLSYEKALEIEPNFGWVKYKLLPQIKANQDSPIERGKTANLKVIITGFENSNGQVMVSLSNSAEDYEDFKDSFRKIKMPIVNNKVELSFDNLPFGEYAISCFHDENKNNKFDKNYLGIPNEPYGFSNNARGRFGPPDFEDIKFRIEKDELRVEIRLK